LLIDYAHKKHYAVVTAQVRKNNAASIRLHKKCGFQIVSENISRRGIPCWIFELQFMDDVINHYDSLIDENNDPVHDPAQLREYMDKWDGQAFIDALELAPDKSVLEIGVEQGGLSCRSIKIIRPRLTTEREKSQSIRTTPMKSALCFWRKGLR
jgi:hypothetical protein